MKTTVLAAAAMMALALLPSSASAATCADYANRAPDTLLAFLEGL
jgi:hypothetical protein